MYYHKEKHHQVNNSFICINAKNTLSGDLKEIENCSWATLSIDSSIVYSQRFYLRKFILIYISEKLSFNNTYENENFVKQNNTSAIAFC